MAGRLGPATFRISPSAGEQPGLAGGHGGQDLAGPVPASSSGAARGWAYAPDSTMVDFIGAVCHPAGDPARGPRLRVRQDLGQGAKNGRLYLKVCPVTPIPPEPPREHRYANNSNLSIDVEHTM